MDRNFFKALIMRASDIYQVSLIVSGAIATALFGLFLYREVYPEYKIYQNDYIALENFRSTYSGEPPPVFSTGVKQIVIEREDKGPPTIDRCISCHVALQYPHFSPTKIARDINGKAQLDEQGNPIQEPNENYIWGRLDKEIADLTDAKVNEQLEKQGESSVVKVRLRQAEDYKALKISSVGDRTYDMTKVLAMHPLMGKETRPFEFHPMEEYGCVSCHNGNGRGLTTEKAHGPVFDGEYHVEDIGPVPRFTESDAKNDPQFAKIFNSKPGHELLFQTTPIFVGSLIESKCVQCHLSSSAALQETLTSSGVVTEHRLRNSKAITASYNNEKSALISLLKLRSSIQNNGVEATMERWKKQTADYTISPSELDRLSSQLQFLQIHYEKSGADQKSKILKLLDSQIDTMTGSAELSKKLEENTVKLATEDQFKLAVDQFVQQNLVTTNATGTLFKKAAEWNLDQELLKHITDTTKSLKATVSDQQFMNSVKSDIDFLTRDIHHGQQLYLSQACYACHRIAGFSRGGVGPDLSRIGDSYPWYIKQSIVWPQADLPSSTMPNYHLDHEELEDLVTFLLSQKGENKAISGANYKIAIQDWESGKKKPWEEPISPDQIHDLRFSMTVFATEGCAACHRLEGFESNVGFTIEKDEVKPSFEDLYQERQWFSKMFPENILGSQIVETIDLHYEEIDQRISDKVRKDSLLEEIDAKYPGYIEALYTDFKYAFRAKNSYYAEKIKAQIDPLKKEKLVKEQSDWKARVKRLMMMYIQEYGLGRLIGPRPNWSGIYRSDEWLMEHFHNPSAHVARSIMPVFPFDDSKFRALTYMLDALAVKNRNAVKEIWNHSGFNPERAFEIHCAQCHGDFRQGNGPVALWIYPIPKNLTNADFLRNLTKERVIQSITHGVKGTPMPPWGEVASDKTTADGIPVLNTQEIKELTNWLFASLSGGQVIKSSEDVLKWQYNPEDVLEELHKEGSKLKPEPGPNLKNSPDAIIRKKNSEIYFASLDPVMPLKKQDTDIREIFDIRPSPVPGPDKYGYYIKKEYYTKENLAQGQSYFEMNCAACHGVEADGSGNRAEVMIDAKPRMLTNLDWINTRDDLRLLRSIKFGVLGTAMTPWGDVTSALQRMQLVMFIRSLTEVNEQRARLSSALYQTFESAQMSIENARIQFYNELKTAQSAYEAARVKNKALRINASEGTATNKEVAESYQSELDAILQMNKLEEIDKKYVELKSLLRDESEIYRILGQTLLTQKVSDKIFDDYIKLIEQVDKDRFEFKDKVLQFHAVPKEEVKKSSDAIIAAIDHKINELQSRKELGEGKIASPELTEKLNVLTHDMNAAIKLKRDLISNLEEAERLREQQADLYKQLEKRAKL